MSLRDALDDAGGGTVRQVASDFDLAEPVSVRDLISFAGANKRGRRPFWLIAHRCNDLPAVREAVGNGANAIECDIRPTGGAIEFVVNHDTDLFAQRDALRPYLDGLVGVLNDNPHVALIIFDCKDGGMDSVRLREVVRDRLTTKVPDVHVLFSIASFDDRHFFDAMAGDVRDREGYAIDEHSDHGAVQGYFDSVGIERCGFGNGHFAYGIKGEIHTSVMGGVARKYRHRKLRMVYTWTLDSEATMRDYIRFGVDGIFVNDVPKLKGVVASMSGVRLARRGDDPFGVPLRRAYVVRVRTADRSQAGTDANLTFRLIGNRGEIATTIDSEYIHMMEADSTNDFAIVGRHVGKLDRLVISMDDQGNGPDWRLAEVGLRATGTDDLHEWSPDRWVTDDDPLTLEA